MSEAGEGEAIREARGKFLCMASAYSLGVFNDNFYKQSVLLMAVAAGHPEMQGYALVIFTFPFVILAAPAGWTADRFSKRSVVIGSKFFELIAMLFGAAGICLGNWPLIFCMLACMGTQSTFFSPALNGSIPELYPPVYVTRANAILRLFVTVAILSGIAMGGLALDIDGVGFRGFPMGRLIVAGGVITIALLGLLVSAGVPHYPAADPKAPFPWAGPLVTIRKLWDTRHDPLLALMIGADVYIWFMGSLQVLLINPLGVQEFELSKTLTSGLIVAQMIGIGLGGVLSSILTKKLTLQQILGPAAFIFSLLMAAMVLVPSCPASLHLWLLFLLMLAIGISGGVILIPVESFIQVRPASKEKGTILAVANFAVFAGILSSGLISNFLNTQLAPSSSFGLVGGLSLVSALWFQGIMKRKADSR